METLSIVLGLGLIAVVIIILVLIVVWRDSRSLKLTQVVKDIARIEQISGEVIRMKDELDKTLSLAKKYQEQSTTQLEIQLKQVKGTLAQLEQKLSVPANGEKREQRERAPRPHQDKQQQNRGKSRSEGRDIKTKEHPFTKGDKEKQDKNNPDKSIDGEKTPKVYNLNSEQSGPPGEQSEAGNS